MADRRELLDRARGMRHQATLAERLLWSRLRGGKPDGLKFRRQVPLGHYIADFACFDPKLIVECDGGQHADSGHDETRDAWFVAQGFHVLRFWNGHVAEDVESVVEAILRAARKG
jgi:very-short-patch-repair endonuclease